MEEPRAGGGGDGERGAVLAPRTATPSAVVDLALDLAEVRATDVLVDVGSNDARVLLRAAEFVKVRPAPAAPGPGHRSRLRCVGVEIDEEACAGAAERVADAGLAGDIDIVCGDVLTNARAARALADCSVVFMFMAPRGQGQLKRKIAEACAPGTRVVSYLFPLHRHRHGAGTAAACGGVDEDPFDAWFVRSESLPSTRPGGIDVSSFSAVYLYRVGGPDSGSEDGATGHVPRSLPAPPPPPPPGKPGAGAGADDGGPALGQFGAEAAEVCAALGVLGFGGGGLPDAPAYGRCEHIRGGITNALVKLTPRDASVASPVVVRVFGAGSERFIDRRHERRVVPQLSRLGLGARVLGTFENGRVERFLGGAVRTLEHADVMDPRSGAPAARGSVLRAMARVVRRFHDCDVRDGAARSCEQLWRTMRTYYEGAMRLTGDGRLAVGADEALDVGALWAEVEELRRACARFASLGTRYTHNDLLMGNFLVDESTLGAPPGAGKPGRRGGGDGEPTIHLIDFEYSCYGSPCYDIANMFNEFAGFECDWARRPGEEVVRAFLAYYLDEHDRHRIDAAVAEIRRYTLVSHLFWVLWSAVQAHESAIDFDYRGYAARRLARYRADRRGVEL